MISITLWRSMLPLARDAGVGLASLPCGLGASRARIRLGAEALAVKVGTTRIEIRMVMVMVMVMVMEKAHRVLVLQAVQVRRLTRRRRTVSGLRSNASWVHSSMRSYRVAEKHLQRRHRQRQKRQRLVALSKKLLVPKQLFSETTMRKMRMKTGMQGSLRGSGLRKKMPARCTEMICPVLGSSMTWIWRKSTINVL